MAGASNGFQDDVMDLFGVELPVTSADGQGPRVYLLSLRVLCHVQGLLVSFCQEFRFVGVIQLLWSACPICVGLAFARAPAHGWPGASSELAAFEPEQLRLPYDVDDDDDDYDGYDDDDDDGDGHDDFDDGAVDDGVDDCAVDDDDDGNDMMTMLIMIMTMMTIMICLS